MTSKLKQKIRFTKICYNITNTSMSAWKRQTILVVQKKYELGESNAMFGYQKERGEKER